MAGSLPGPAAEQSWAGQYSLREWHAQDGLPSEDVFFFFIGSAGVERGFEVYKAAFLLVQKVDTGFAVDKVGL